MTKNNPRKLIKDTLKQIQEGGLKNPGRRTALDQSTLDSIHSLREYLSPKQIIQELSLPSCQVYKASSLNREELCLDPSIDSGLAS